MSINEMTERINQDIENNKNSIKQKEEAINKAKEEKKKLEGEIENLNKEIIEIKQNVENSGSKIEEYKKSKEVKNIELEKLEEEIEKQFKRLQELKEQLVKIDLKKTKLNQDLEDVVNKMWEEYELTPNNAHDYKEVTDPAKTQKDVNNLRNQIRDLGSINIDSIDEYKTLKERYDFMCEQRLDLENSMAKLRNVISEMITIMKEQFKKNSN